MSEEVSVPGLVIMTSIVFEESFERDTHTDGQTLASSIVNFFKVA